MKQIELLAPAGSMANLKAAISRKADAVYLGLNLFSARAFASNFNETSLKKAVNLCKANNVKLYLTMNTLVKDNELKDFFSQLSSAYSAGIDAVIIQEISFLNIIKKNFPDLRVHISTQAGVINSEHANILPAADRITLARELTNTEIRTIKNNCRKELEVFCHGALCVSVSGSCLFSSLLGGRSGNRGQCAQPCRKKYNNCYHLSLKDLCLIDRIPSLIAAGVDSLKIEGRMRTPYYVAAATEVYRKAIDSYYAGDFTVTQEMKKKLYDAFNREFTEGWFSESKLMFNRESASGKSSVPQKEEYTAVSKETLINRKKITPVLPEIKKLSSPGKTLTVRVYRKKDAYSAASSGADIIVMDLLDPNFKDIKGKIKAKLFAATPRIMLDSDIPAILKLIKEKKPDGIFAGNLGILNLNLNIPVILDYNSNSFNTYDINYFNKLGAVPVISPELSIKEQSMLSDKRFISFVHGKIKLMTLRHELKEEIVYDETRSGFRINKIPNGSEVLNGKELGLLGKSSVLVRNGITNLFVDTDTNVSGVINFYRDVLDGKKVDDSKMRKSYVLGWSYRGVI